MGCVLPQGKGRFFFDRKCKLRDGDLAPLAGRPMSINIRFNDAISNAFFEHAGGATYVGINNCDGVSSGCFAFFSAAEEVDIIGLSSLTEANLSLLKGVTKLGLVTSDPADQADFTHRCFEGWSKLRCLEILLPSLTDAMLLPLDRLENVNIMSSDHFSGSGLRNSASTLIDGSFSYCGISSESLRDLRELRGLELTGCDQVTDAAFFEGSHPKLCALTINGCPDISSVGLSHLKTLSSLFIKGNSMPSLTPAVVVAVLSNLRLVRWRRTTFEGFDASPLIAAGFESDSKRGEVASIRAFRRHSLPPASTPQPASAPTNPPAVSTASSASSDAPEPNNPAAAAGEGQLTGNGRAGDAGDAIGSSNSAASSSSNSSGGGRLVGVKRVRTTGSSEEE